MLRVIIREKLSERAVMKEMGSDGCIFKRGDNTNRNLVRAITKSKSRTQTVSNGRVGRQVKNRGV